MRIAVGNDHRGYLVKEKLVRVLRQWGHEVEDDGTQDRKAVDYPDIAGIVSRKVAEGCADRGILICGTGIGMSIAANKVRGVRAAPCQDELTAEIIRRHNDTNVLCLSADMLGGRDFEAMVRVWLDTDFEGGRHARRLEKIAALEQARVEHEPLAEDPEDRPGDCGA
jgi:ribose 5-phosphate isomerase B